MRRDRLHKISKVNQDIDRLYDFILRDPVNYRGFDFSPINSIVERIERAGGGEQTLEDRQLWLAALQEIARQAPSLARIRKFERFCADESLAGGQCMVCLEDLRVGTEMIRLGCHVTHYLCHNCAHSWFEKNNKCPMCNHVFELDPEGKSLLPSKNDPGEKSATELFDRRPVLYILRVLFIIICVALFISTFLIMLKSWVNF